MSRRAVVTVTVIVVTLITTGCLGDDTTDLITQPEPTIESIEITSTTFEFDYSTDIVAVLSTLPLTTTTILTTTSTAPVTTTTTTTPVTEPPSTEPPTTTTEPPTTVVETTVETTILVTTTAAPEPEPEEPTTTATTARSEPPTTLGGGWARMRQCESGGDYSINTGNGYYGAYQFNQSTWNGVVARMGRSDLVGVRASSASPSDQDAAAQQLYSERGSQPWPVCGAYL